MARYIEPLSVKIARLTTPEGWPPLDTTDPAHVERLADELDGGRILPPVRVRANGDRLEIIQGHHRVAAYVRAGRESIPCDLVEYESDAEAELDMIAENLVRRLISGPERDRAITRMVELRAIVDGAPIPEEGISCQNDEKLRDAPGRPKEAERAAILSVAGDVGVSESTVRRAMASVNDPEPEPKAPRVVAMPSVLDWYGCKPVPEVDAAALALSELVGDLLGRINSMSRVVTSAVEREDLPQEIELLMQQLRGALKQAAPKSCCPWCKGHRTECGPCGGRGFSVVSDSRKDLPHELTLRGADACRAEGGRFVRVKDGRPYKEPKRIKIVDENGEELL